MLRHSILRRRPTPATAARRLHLSSVLGRRAFRASAPVLHGDFEMQDPASPEDIVRFVIVDRDARRHDVAGKVGDNLLYLCHRLRDEHAAGAKLALEGACEASLACSTCHVIISSEHYDLLDEAIEEEEDMLDEATCLTATSRLGCQIILSKKLDGMVVTLPAYSRKCVCQPLRHPDKRAAGSALPRLPATAAVPCAFMIDRPRRATRLEAHTLCRARLPSCPPACRIRRAATDSDKSDVSEA
jgi:ferredoxin-2, mitochondrial